MWVWACLRLKQDGAAQSIGRARIGQLLIATKTNCPLHQTSIERSRSRVIIPAEPECVENGSRLEDFCAYLLLLALEVLEYAKPFIAGADEAEARNIDAAQKTRLVILILVS